MALIQTENKNLVRDTSSKALLLNTLKTEEEYQLKRKLFEENKQKNNDINIMRKELDEIKSDIQLIKELLLKALNDTN